MKLLVIVTLGSQLLAFSQRVIAAAGGLCFVQSTANDQAASDDEVIPGGPLCSSMMAS